MKFNTFFSWFVSLPEQFSWMLVNPTMMVSKTVTFISVVGSVFCYCANYIAYIRHNGGEQLETEPLQ